MCQWHHTPTYDFYSIRSNLLALARPAGWLSTCQKRKENGPDGTAAPSSQLRSDNEHFMLIGVYQRPMSVGALPMCLDGPGFCWKNKIGSLRPPTLLIPDGNARPSSFVLRAQRCSWMPDRHEQKGGSGRICPWIRPTTPCALLSPARLLTRCCTP